MAEHCSFGKWNYELSVAVKYWSNQWFKMTLWNLRGKKTKPPNPNPSSLIDCKINWPATCQYHAILKSSSHLPLSRSMQSSKKKKKKAQLWQILLPSSLTIYRWCISTPHNGNKQCSHSRHRYWSFTADAHSCTESLFLLNPTVTRWTNGSMAEVF